MRAEREKREEEKKLSRSQTVDLHRLDRSDPPSFREVGFDFGFELDVCNQVDRPSRSAREHRSKGKGEKGREGGETNQASSPRSSTAFD